MSAVDMVFQDFCDDIWQAGDEGKLREAIGHAAGRLGFRWYAYLGLGHGAPILISSYARDWTDHYFERSYELVDPVVRSAQSGNRLFSWSREDPAFVRTRQQRSFFGEAKSFGIASGLTVPIRTGRGKLAALTLATDRTAAETNRLVAANSEALELISLYFHSRVDATLGSRMRVHQRSGLTGRELQCLTWAARGKTASETADILAVSRRTVTFHLENARSKLDSATVTQAVYRSTVAGFIPPE